MLSAAHGPPAHYAPLALTPDQTARLLQHIGMPKDGRQGVDDLTYLRRLMRLHLQRVPFGSVALHYAENRDISVVLDDIFEKCVTNSRGGYCMELNTLFAGLLRALGYDIYTAAGRVKAGGPKWSGPTHMVIIVTIQGQRYLVDVGFGASAGFCPILMDTSLPAKPFTVIGTRRGRLEYRSIEVLSQDDQKVWVLSTQEGEGDEWVEQNAIGEAEVCLSDIEVMNYYANTSPRSFFVQNFFAMRLVCGDLAEDYAPAQIVTVFRDRVRWFTPGGDDRTLQLESEAERVALLEKEFFIKLSKTEQDAMLGTSNAIVPT